MTKFRAKNVVEHLGKECFKTKTWKFMENTRHHDNISRADHCKNVARLSVQIADFFGKNYDKESLVRAALLHDAFMYDWHESCPKTHAFTHGKEARIQAEKELSLNEIEANAIEAHMFPLSTAVPKSKEAVYVCLADKISAAQEYIQGTLSKAKYVKKEVSKSFS